MAARTGDPTAHCGGLIWASFGCGRRSTICKKMRQLNRESLSSSSFHAPSAQELGPTRLVCLGAFNHPLKCPLAGYRPRRFPITLPSAVIPKYNYQSPLPVIKISDTCGLSVK
jgi:hypothetical protein